MFFARLVVKQNAFLNCVLNNFTGNLNPFFLSSFASRQSGGNFQDVVRASGIATGVAGDLFEDFIIGVQFQRTESTFRIGKSTPEQQHNLLFGKGLMSATYTYANTRACYRANENKQRARKTNSCY